MTPANPEIALVLAGGGARGAYEVGVLRELLPFLDARGERPGIIVGTSIGALNGTFIASTMHEPADEAMERGIELWRGVRYSDICGPLVSVDQVARLVTYISEVARIPCGTVRSLLGNAPMKATIGEKIDFDQLQRNVEANQLSSIAVVATSYATGESVAFHQSHDTSLRVERDDKRAIRYEATPLDAVHVRASAAIPVFFPAVDVDGPGYGWYGDGGTRLNTPIKPALKLGARRVVVAALNSSVDPDADPRREPDVFDGVAQFMQPLLTDQLLQDVATLAARNQTAGQDVIPYILVAPKGRLAIGEIAQKVYEECFSGVGSVMDPESRDLASLGRLVSAGRNATRGDLLSFLFFERVFADRLIELGREDARRFIAGVEDGDPWSVAA
ncbi:patatin-like phospholipase family protein [Solirubrobacter soli]|uniref:patatin-like phospholipase family protein n=1 Tax=Solirubrobacter soli TaxID=363832 RepID=UPI000404EF17|nr:patatin-like phospholipase family protein [Solirubrobacter soli]